jgi:5,10-methylenetetrahydromethanopterin reductase
VTADGFVRLAVAAEEEGFDQVWVSHDLFWRSAPVLLTLAARATSRIAIGAGVFNPVSMHPVEIAMVAATMQEVSDGRFLLGLGAGAEAFLDSAGMAREPPLARTRSALEVIRALLSGKRWPPQAHLRVGPAPTPIYVGAMGPRMLSLAGELADGVLPLLFPPEHYVIAAAQIAAGAARAGRDPADIDVAACLWCSIDLDRERGRRALAEKIAYYGPSFEPSLLARAGLSLDDFRPIEAAMAAGAVDQAAALVSPAMLALGVAGRPEDLARRCAGLVRAGARHLSFGPPLGPDPERAVRVIGREVLPTVRTEA